MYWNALLREITASADTLLKSVMMSSLMPSEKYSCSGSPLILAKGSTQSDSLRATPAAAGRTIELRECLCADAFPAVLAGDVETHDRLLRKALTYDLDGVDLIVLAQASMARVVETLPAGTLKSAVLSSPALAVKRARQVLLEPQAVAEQHA